MLWQYQSSLCHMSPNLSVFILTPPAQEGSSLFELPLALGAPRALWIKSNLLTYLSGCSHFLLQPTTALSAHLPPRFSDPRGCRWPLPSGLLSGSSPPPPIPPPLLLQLSLLWEIIINWWFLIFQWCLPPSLDHELLGSGCMAYHHIPGPSKGACV